MEYYAAPMEGVTGFLWRSAHSRWFSGVDQYFMPFLSPTQAHRFSKRDLQELLPEHNDGIVAIPQFLTRNATDFLCAANMLKDMGYREVNLNLGCPSGTVVAKGKGSGFLSDLEGLDRFLDSIYSSAPLSISVKTRLGRTNPAEFGPLLEIYNKYPISELILHPRIQKDMYRHPARWDDFVAAFPLSKAPMGYNGDLSSPTQISDLSTQFPKLHSVMVGRSLIADPALFAKARGGASATVDSLRSFHEDLYEGYSCAFGSNRNAMMRMKELWFYLICLFGDHEAYAKKLRKAQDPAVYEGLVAGIFRDLPLLEQVIPMW